MKDGKEQAILRAGVLIGLGAGLALGCGAMMVADALGLSARLLAVQPTVITLGIAPLICFVSGVQMLKKAKAAH